VGKNKGAAATVPSDVYAKYDKNGNGKLDDDEKDALKKDYLQYLKLLEPRLKPGAVIVADNVIRSANEMKDFLDYVQTSPDYDTVIIRASLEKQDGMSISFKIK
jgi:hypothetical protein